MSTRRGFIGGTLGALGAFCSGVAELVAEPTPSRDMSRFTMPASRTGKTVPRHIATSSADEQAKAMYRKGLLSAYEAMERMS